MITLRLPVPPSTNALYANRKGGRGKGRYKTQRYKQWFIDADWCYRRQWRDWKFHRISGPFTAEIKIPKTRGDADNRVKPILDFLVRRAITDDDKHCRKVSVEVDPSLDCCHVTVRAA